MKKTLITMMALVGLASADVVTPQPVLTLTDVDLSQTMYASIDNTLGLNTTTGVTVMLTVNWTGISNSPMFWIGTDDGSAYANSAATIGYRGNIHHASLFSTSGSNSGITNLYNNQVQTIKTEDYVAAFINNTAKNNTHKDDTLVYFMTTLNGETALYTLLNDDDRSLVKLCTQGNMATGDITAYHVGNWNGGDSAQTGTATIALFNGVLSEAQMRGLAPEPATATLSLLALAGLAARRRRH
ncbi:MAG: hypothetical protein MJ051_04230 [Akkermansia sp.]|nr:hypothetical protein [Akkermansia sp.]